MNLALKAQFLHRHAQMHFRAVIALDGKGVVLGGVLGGVFGGVLRVDSTKLDGRCIKGLRWIWWGVG